VKRVIYDTGVYVDYLRRGDHARTVETATRLGIVHLSAVVAQELVVGAPDRAALRFLERLVERFDALGRLAIPGRLDWLRAGRAIREVGRRHGYEEVGRARLTNDALILATALRIGAALVTGNAGDFALLRQHLAGVVVDVHVPP
jgi:predicted nucleic acid-binding protein